MGGRVEQSGVVNAVEARMTAVTSLTPAPWNPRSIKDGRLANLCKSIEADPGFLWNRPVLATADGTIYAGNMRYRAAVKLGWTSIPAIVEDVPDKVAKERALRDNAQWGEWEDDDLSALVYDLKSLGSDMDLLGFEPADVGKLLEAHGGAKAGLTDPDDVPEELEAPTTQPGDLWLLGNHRILCGDATNRADVAAVMNGELAEMVWTDPPYGVAIGDKNKFLNSIAQSNRIEENLQNDTLDEPGLMAMLEAAFRNAVDHCTAGAAWYVAAPPGPLHVLFGQALKELGIWRQTIQWVKNNATFAPMGVDYHWQAEPIFYGWLPNARHRYRGGRKQTTVWGVDRPQKSPEHPTMKPVELVTRAIENSSDQEQIVLDVFLGSGTTLIAAEQLGRRCYGIELEPKYCDVIVRRWEQFTGKAAERVSALVSA